MSGAQVWQAARTSALLGTQRAPYQAPDVSGALGELLAQVVQDAAPGEESLLRVLAVAALYRRAGSLPAGGAPEPALPCPIEDLPRCSPAAGKALDAILSGDSAALLPEWLGLAVQHGVRVREEHLEPLFRKPRWLEKYRALALAAMGERGRWLARQIPALRWFLPPAEEATWLEGPRRERTVFLADLRAADPAGARRLLASTWSEETPADKVEFLNSLREQLSMEDEDFLEAALGERRKEVRQAAAGLLCLLPESRLARQVTGLAVRLVTWKTGLLRATLDVSLPEAYDDTLQRAGIELRPPPGWKFGEKASWLAQILALTPSQSWCTAWNKRPGQILAAARRHEWEDVLVAGWKNAAIHCQDQEWLKALVYYELQRSEGTRLLELFHQLPGEIKEMLVVSMLADHPALSYEGAISVLLSACHHPWGAELTRSVTTAICWELQKGVIKPWEWEKLLRDIAPWFQPGLLGEAATRIDAAHKRSQHSDAQVTELVAVLRFRQEMHRAFGAQPEPGN